MAIRGNKATRVATIAVCSLGIFAFVFLLMGRIDAALVLPRTWALNLFTTLPTEVSWNLGNLTYALLFGGLCGVLIGVPTGLMVGERKVAAFVTLFTLMSSAALMFLLSPPGLWSVVLFSVVVCVATGSAWFSSTLKDAHAP